MKHALVNLEGEEFIAYEMPIIKIGNNPNLTIFGGREHLERVQDYQAKKVKQNGR